LFPEPSLTIFIDRSLCEKVCCTASYHKFSTYAGNAIRM
jgi:hypothetical protein